LGVVFRRLDGRRLRGLAIFLAAVAAVYSLVLVELFRFAAQRSELYSHIFLVPLIAAYLAGLKVGELPENTDTARRAGALVAAFAAGLLVLALLARRGGEISQADYLALAVVSVPAWAAAGILWFFGAGFLRVLAFPLGFLTFMAPFPAVVEHGIEVFFQRTSAEAAHALMNLTGLTVARDGQFFRLPGITLEVAAECSGIRSSYVLFITSLVAGYVLLRRPWTRTTLALLVIPLGIVRNGLRIVTIALLCVHVSPSMIDSPIHHRGGPIFFGLSLLPFFAALLLLRRWEKKRCQPPTATSADALR
jgi:exosortase C (VPDSG-CTERM-specific)